MYTVVNCQEGFKGMEALKLISFQGSPHAEIKAYSLGMVWEEFVPTLKLN